MLQAANLAGCSGRGLCNPSPAPRLAALAWKRQSSSSRARLEVPRGFFSTFIGGLSKGPVPETGGRSGAPLEEGLGEERDEILLVETLREDGSSARILFRNGGVIDALSLEELCVKVGWPARPQHKVKAALANSFLVSSLTVHVSRPGDGALRPPSESERLIGLARATSDHAFNATIWDVLIDPEYQGQGLGKALVEHMVRSLLRREINNITLFSDSKAVDFYQQLGFQADPDGIKGMFWYPR